MPISVEQCANTNKVFRDQLNKILNQSAGLGCLGCGGASICNDGVLHLTINMGSQAAVDEKKIATDILQEYRDIDAVQIGTRIYPR